MTNFRRIKRMNLDETAEMVRLIVEAGCLNMEAKTCDGCVFERICTLWPGTDDAKEWLQREEDF